MYCADRSQGDGAFTEPLAKRWGRLCPGFSLSEPPPGRTMWIVPSHTGTRACLS